MYKCTLANIQGRLRKLSTYSIYIKKKLFSKWYNKEIKILPTQLHLAQYLYGDPLEKKIFILIYFSQIDGNIISVKVKSVTEIS